MNIQKKSYVYLPQNIKKSKKLTEKYVLGDIFTKMGLLGQPHRGYLGNCLLLQDLV